VIMSPQSKYWGDDVPLSHMDRRPCWQLSWSPHSQKKNGASSPPVVNWLIYFFHLNQSQTLTGKKNATADAVKTVWEPCAKRKQTESRGHSK